MGSSDCDRKELGVMSNKTKIPFIYIYVSKRTNCRLLHFGGTFCLLLHANSVETYVICKILIQ
jgi:hypothetical protein